MRKVSFALLLGLILSLCLSGCTSTDNPNQNYILLTDLEGQKIGIVEGMTTETQVEESIPNAKIKSFATVMDGAEALRNKKIKALILDKRNAEKYLKGDDDFVTMLENFSDKKYFAAHFVTDKEDGDRFLLTIDASISKFKISGLQTQLYEKYFDNEPPKVADFTYNEGKTEGKVLKVGVAEDNAPFSYKDENGVYIGYDVEFANEVAKNWGAKLEIVAYPRSKLLNATKNGEVKMVLGRFTKLDDKDEHDWLLFSEDYYDGTQIVVLNREDVNANVVQN